METIENRRDSPEVVPAAPGRWPLLGHLPGLVAGRQRYMQSLRNIADVVHLRLGPRTAYVVNSPELLRRILVVESGSVERGRLFDKMRLFTGNGIGLSDGDFHLRQRRMVQPGFHRELFPRYVEIIRTAVQDATRSWRAGVDVTVDRQMQALSLDVMAMTMFSTHISDEDAATIRRCLPVLIRGALWRTLDPFDLLELLPTPGNGRRLAAAGAEFDRVLDGLIAAYRADDSTRRDLVAVLMSARNPDTSEPMPDEQLRSEIRSVLIGGSETVGHVLTGLFYEIGRDPQAQARIYAEIVEVLGNRPIEYADVPKLTYTARVVREALRLHTPLWMLTRRTTSPIEIADTVLPAGTDVLLSPYALHRDPLLYPDPLRFDPDRWLSEDIAKLPRGAYMPFLLGVHQCIGEHFALMELVVVAATVLAKWRMQPSGPAKVVCDVTVHLQGLQMALAPRETAGA
jgi:cytochrome P450